MYKTTLQVIKALYNLKDMVIEWPNKDVKRKESMENNTGNFFFGFYRKSR